jgi:RNase P/RNase MRP subunit p29
MIVISAEDRVFAIPKEDRVFAIPGCEGGGK